MPVNIEGALKRGVNRTIARNGLFLIGVLFVVTAVNALVGVGVSRSMGLSSEIPGGVPFGGEATGAVFAIHPVVGGLVSLLTTLVTIVIAIGALRTFVSDETEYLPRAHFTQNIVWPGLNVLIGGIVFAIIVGIGFIFFIIPGIFLLVTLIFWSVYVAVEDRNFIAGMQESWGLTKGHRLKLFILGVTVVVVSIVVSAVFGIGGLAGGSIGLIATQLGGAITTVFMLATLAATYDQLTGSPPQEIPSTTDSQTPSPT